MPKVSVIIPTQMARPDLLTECLKALALSEYADFECLVMVNGSESEFGAKSKEIQRQVAQLSEASDASTQWIFLGSNTGFTGAVNAGIARSDSELVALLNDDAIPDPAWLGELVRTQESAGAEMIASTIYLAATEATIDSKGFSFAWRGKAEALRSTSPEFAADQDYWLTNPDLLPATGDRPSQEPFGPDAAACLYTRDLLTKLNGFNPSFFAYLEDVDLALRARRAGYTCALAPKAVVHHHKHATSSKQSSFKQQQDFINWLRITAKTYPRAAWKRFGWHILTERGRNLSGLLKY